MLVKPLRKRSYVYNDPLHRQLNQLRATGIRRIGDYLDGYKISFNKGLSDRLLNQAQDIGISVIKHPLQIEMIKGILSQKRFEIFIVQNILYLEGCIKSLEIACVRFPEQSDLFELLIIDTKDELNKYKELRTRFTIDKNFEQMNHDCAAYVSFLGGVAEKGELVEIIGAFWACSSVFLEMHHFYIREINLLSYEHPYYELVKYYQELHLPSIQKMKKVMNDILIRTNKEERMQFKKLFFRYFYNSLEYERKFFDAVYESNRKIAKGIRIINSVLSIKERLLEMPPRSWVLWDLDNTIWISDLILLRLENNNLLEKYILDSQPQQPYIRQWLWELHYHCDYSLVEEDIIGLFSDLKKIEISVLGLTKRKTGYPTIGEFKGNLTREDLTLKQLNKLGVFFSSIFPEEILLKEQVGINPAILKNGIAFTSGLHKGIILTELLDKAKELDIEIPPQIAFFDDLNSNICDVQESLETTEEYNIPFIPIHYRGSDNHLTDDCMDYEELNRQIRDLARTVFKFPNSNNLE